MFLRVKYCCLAGILLLAGCSGNDAAACPTADAALVHEAPVTYPDSARDLGIGPVTVQVNVTVGPDGDVQGATLYKSSGNSVIDRSALVTATQSTYSPKVVNCAGLVGNVLLTVNFAP